MAAAIAFVILIAIAIVAFAAYQGRGRRNVLAELARAMGGQATSNSAAGTYARVATRLAFESRGTGSTSENWTYVDCALPPGYPFTLHLERHGWFDAGKIERGEMIDVVVGDPPFDERFRIEGAPAEVVRRVLTAPVRAYLMAQARVEVVMKGALLRLAVRGWLDEVATARAAIDCATAIAGGVRDASLALDAELPLAHDGPAYRAIASDAPLQEARAARAAEVAKVDVVRAGRLARQRLMVWGVLIAIFVAFMAMMSR